MIWFASGFVIVADANMLEVELDILAVSAGCKGQARRGRGGGGESIIVWTSLLWGSGRAEAARKGGADRESMRGETR